MEANWFDQLILFGALQGFVLALVHLEKKRCKQNRVNPFKYDRFTHLCNFNWKSILFDDSLPEKVLVCIYLRGYYHLSFWSYHLFFHKLPLRKKHYQNGPNLQLAFFTSSYFTF